MDEAKAEADANSHEAKAEAVAKIALIFSAKLYILTQLSPKERNFRSIFDGTSKSCTTTDDLE